MNSKTRPMDDVIWFDVPTSKTISALSDSLKAFPIKC